MIEKKDFNIEELVKLVQETNDLAALKTELETYHEYELAELFKELTEYDLVKIYSVFTNDEIGEILSYIDSDDASEILESLNDTKVAQIINTMEPDDAIDIIQELDEDKQSAIISLLDEEQKQDIIELGLYDDDTAGSIMNSNYISIISGSDIKAIMKEIIARAPEVESITTSFVVDPSGALLGTLDLKKIIVTKSPTTVDEIMNKNFKFVDVYDNLDITTNVIQKYDVYTLPVLEDGILKGIITMDDALETLIEESEDDYVKFAAVSESLEMDEKLILSVKTRLPWLALLLVLNIIIALVISRFDYIFQIPELAILIVFQPILLDLAGNTGTQSLAITITAISKKELDTFPKILNHIFKEFLFGLVAGIALAAVSILIAFIVIQNSNTTLKLIEIIPALTLAIASSSVFANLAGTLIPIILYKIKIDPAAASGPLITTLVDIFTIIIYYGLVTLLIYNTI